MVGLEYHPLGHIHDTWFVTTSGAELVLQRLNDEVFPDDGAPDDQPPPGPLSAGRTAALAGGLVALLAVVSVTARSGDHDRAVLVGTRSFWQGIDAPGVACVLVVIDRIPFPSPGDPLHAARRERAEAMELNAPAGVSGDEGR